VVLDLQHNLTRLVVVLADITLDGKAKARLQRGENRLFCLMRKLKVSLTKWNKFYNCILLPWFRLLFSPNQADGADITIIEYKE